MASSAASRPRVGFVGLGNMGRPMAARIAAAGFPLTVMDADPAVTATVAEECGGSAQTDLSALAAHSDILVTMLPTGAIVDKVVSAAAPMLPPGAVVIDMSSSEPQGTIALGRSLSARGIELLDAPVSGGVRRAADGTLAIIVGGAADTVAQVVGLLKTMGSTMHIGALGSGHAMKALNNYVSAVGLTAACEAVIVAERFGIEPQTAVDVLNQSTGRNVATETKISQFVLSGSFAAGFGAALMAKDLRTACALGRNLGVGAPLLETSARIWTEGAEQLGREADHTAIYRYIENLAQARG